MGDAGLHRDRRLERTHRNGRLLAEQYRAGPGRDRPCSEQLGHRAQPPFQEAGRLGCDVPHLQFIPLESLALLPHLTQNVHDLTEALGLIGKGLDQALAITIPTHRNPEGEVREDQRRKAIRIQRAEDHPLRETNPVQDARDQSVATALSEVVDSHVELVAAVADPPAEDLGVSPGHVVGLQDQGALSRPAQIGGRAETPEPRPDHDGIPALPVSTRHESFPRPLSTARPAPSDARNALSIERLASAPAV